MAYPETREEKQAATALTIAGGVAAFFAVWVGWTYYTEGRIGLKGVNWQKAQDSLHDAKEKTKSKAKEAKDKTVEAKDKAADEV